MQSQPKRLCAYALAGGALAAALSLSAPSLNAQSALFTNLAGSWSGEGRVDLQDGTSERIRCRASYSVGDGGSTLQQQLRCASDNYRFEVSSSVQSQGGARSGSWSEPTRNVTGQ